VSEAVQRALDNLRFDRMVKAFCLISPDNAIYQSTLDSSVEAMVKQTISLYQGRISQLTVNTEQGLVIISKVADEWLLTVLFPPNLSLGIAVVKTKATLLALRELDLSIVKTMPRVAAAGTTVPAPSITAVEPIATEEEAEKPATPVVSPAPRPVVRLPQTPTVPTRLAAPATETEKPPAPFPAERPPPIRPPPATEQGRIGLSFVPKGGDALLAALDKGSSIGGSLSEKFGPFARDVLFLVDGKRDVKTIAFLLGLPEYAIVEVLEFALQRNVLAR
jgi:predicted regulator of Ras-like GTPase activity (Roadblock/LC7/MglB family)